MSDIKLFNYSFNPVSFLGLSWWRIHLQCRRPGFDPWAGKIPWRRARQTTPVFLGFPRIPNGDSWAQMVKNPLAMQETWVWFLGWEDTLEKGTVTHSTILAWRIPWTEEPGRLQSMGSQSWTWLTNFHSCFPNSLIMSFDYFPHTQTHQIIQQFPFLLETDFRGHPSTILFSLIWIFVLLICYTAETSFLLLSGHFLDSFLQ